MRHQFGRNTHVLLLLDHLPDHVVFVIPCLLAARFRALEQPVISLRIEKPFLVKSCFLETVVYIGRQDEIIFILYKCKQLVIYRFRGVA